LRAIAFHPLIVAYAGHPVIARPRLVMKATVKTARAVPGQSGNYALAYPDM